MHRAALLLILAAPAWAQPVDAPGQRPAVPSGSVAAGLGARDPGQRARAARLAGERGARQQVAALVALLGDEAWTVRAEAARALGRLRAREGLRELLVLAQTDPEAPVREAAAAAVKQIDLHRFVSSLATSDPPPVRPLPPSPPPPAPGRSVLLSLGLGLNALRPAETFAGSAGAALRFRPVEVQLTLAFPAITLAGQVRVVLLDAWLAPYLQAGFAMAYNNGSEDRHAAAVIAGGGLRLGPLGRRFYGFVEVMASHVLYQPRPAGRVEMETFALPIFLGAMTELWP